MEELKSAVAGLHTAIESLASTVVSEIAEVNAKLAELGNPDLSEPIAKLAALASRVAEINEQVAGIIPTEVIEPEDPEADDEF